MRAKLAGMIARTESIQNWLENITYQMCNMVRAYVYHAHHSLMIIVQSSRIGSKQIS